MEVKDWEKEGFQTRVENRKVVNYLKYTAIIGTHVKALASTSDATAAVVVAAAAAL